MKYYREKLKKKKIEKKNHACDWISNYNERSVVDELSVTALWTFCLISLLIRPSRQPSSLRESKFTAIRETCKVGGL